MTLNDLLEITEVKHMTLHVPVTPRVSTRIDFAPNDSAILDDIAGMYGDYRVGSIKIGICEAPRLVVELQGRI